MSSFTTPAILELRDHYKWRICAPFSFYSDHFPTLKTIDVPMGFITDLASVPQILWMIFPPHGPYAKAAIIHDYLYETATFSKPVADLIFLEAMTVLKVPPWRRTLMYWAVRWFGKGNY